MKKTIKPLPVLPAAQVNLVDPKIIFKNEHDDFNPFIGQRLNEIGQAIGIPLDLVGVEHKFQTLRLDVLAKERSTQRNVVIESQLEASRDDHAIRLIRYAQATQASAVVWIAPSFSEPHLEFGRFIHAAGHSLLKIFLLRFEILEVTGGVRIIQFERLVPAPMLNSISRAGKRAAAVMPLHYMWADGSGNSQNLVANWRALLINVLEFASQTNTDLNTIPTRKTSDPTLIGTEYHPALIRTRSGDVWFDVHGDTDESIHRLNVILKHINREIIITLSDERKIKLPRE
jgi:hypothetical protein